MAEDLPPPGSGPADDVDWVAGTLGALPPVSMPPDVWGRLQETLAREAAAATTGTTGAVVPLVRRRRWVPAVLVAAAAVVLAGVVLPRLGGDSPGPIVATATAGGVASSNAPVGTIDALPAHHVVASGTDYAAARFTDQVLAVLGSVGMRAVDEVVERTTLQPASATPALVGADGMTADFQALHDCVAAFAGGGDKPPALVVDRARYDGQDAAVIVLVKSLSVQPLRATLHIVVVRPSCTEADRADARQVTVQLPAS